MKIEQKESNKDITTIGIVREIEDNWKSCRVGIAAENGSYVVRMNEEGKNLQYEVGNKVEATGIILRTSSSYSGENRNFHILFLYLPKHRKKIFCAIVNFKSC